MISIVATVLLVFVQRTWSAETLLSKLYESCRKDVSKFCGDLQPKRLKVLRGCLLALEEAGLL
jgi:hypothetical protein